MADPPAPASADFESTPLTRPEYIQAVVHFYRGEIYRSNVWRRRLDATTNWAVLTTAAVLTFTFSSPERTHLLLVLCSFVVLAFLFIEARRFRYFSVYRARVRMLEENFLLPILTRQLVSPIEGWRDLVARDLEEPKFKNTLLEALALRIRYNYFWIFSFVGSAWLLKVWLHPVPARTWREMYEHMAVPPLPAWVVLGVGVLFFVAVWSLFLVAGRISALTEDEVRGIEVERDRWRI